jgi:hypothetical protein
MDWQNISPILITVCIGGGILLVAMFTIAATVLPMLGIFGGIGWFLNKKSKEARALKEEAKNWASTTGKVVSSRVEVSGGDHTTVSPHIVFQYNVYGRDYSGSQIKAGDEHWASYNSRAAYDIVDKYPVGTEVNVYYDPENPEQSALER